MAGAGGAGSKAAAIRRFCSLYKKRCGRKCVAERRLLAADMCRIAVLPPVPFCLHFVCLFARNCAARIRLLAKKSVKNILILVFSAY